MELDELRQAMREGARALTATPVSDKFWTPLIPLARKLGLQVTLQLYRPSAGRGVATGGQDGILKYSPPPEIVLFRSTIHDLKKSLSPADEQNLSARERFSIAHEIAHWYAFKRFGIEPEKFGTSIYWQHEKIMQDFAGVLIIPDRLLDKWMNAIGEDGIANIHHVSRWVRDADVSFSALSGRVTERQPGTGFLKLAVGLEKPKKSSRGAPRLVLGVLPEVSSNGIDLPNNYALVRNDRLIEKLRSSEKGLKEWMPSVSFDNKRIQNLYLWWRQTNLYRGEKIHHLQKVEDVYWTSWTTQDIVESSFG